MALDRLSISSFIAVAETRSFTRAAARVGRSQSAVSQQIAKIEQLLGQELFARGKALGLTDQGEIFLSYARRIQALHGEILDRFREPELAGEVRFGLPEDFASVYLSEVLAEFARGHPRVQLSIECDLTLNLFARFQDREFDLVLVKMNRPEDFPNGSDVLREPLAWVGDESLAAGSDPLPLVMAPSPCVYRAAAMEALERTGRRWRQTLTSPSHAGTIAAVSAGLGLTVLPRPMVPPTLKAVAPGLVPPLGHIHVSLLKHRSDKLATNSLEAVVLEKLRR